MAEDKYGQQKRRDPKTFYSSDTHSKTPSNERPIEPSLVDRFFEGFSGYDEGADINIKRKAEQDALKKRRLKYNDTNSSE